MDTPEMRALMEALDARFKAILQARGVMEGARLASFRAPYFLSSLGFCANISLFNSATFVGPNGDFVVIGRADLRDPDEAFAELDARIAAMAADPTAALARPLEASLGLRPIEPSDALFDDELQNERRAAAVAEMDARFDAVAAKVKEHFGLRIPRWMAVLAALFRSATPLERAGLEFIGTSPGGLLDYFEDGGLDRVVREGLDPRVEMRFRRDPPEFQSFLWGDTDGLHWGLFYDDPAELPGAIVHNYARDSAETWLDQATSGVALLSARLRESMESAYEDERPPLSAFALRAALRWFSTADREAIDRDGIVRYRGVARPSMLGAVSAVLPASAGNARLDPAKVEARCNEYKRGRSKILSEWIMEAREELAKGKPAFAYTLGRELHWFDSDKHRKVGEELLLAAYEALGRHALADIARAHYKHRDLPMVSAFEASERQRS